MERQSAQTTNKKVMEQLVNEKELDLILKEQKNKTELKLNILKIFEQDDFNVNDIQLELDNFRDVADYKLINKAVEISSQVLNIPISVMKSKSKSRIPTISRYFIFYYFRVTKYRYFTQEYLGSIFNRDHATVLHAERVFPNDLETNYKETRDKFNLFVEKLKIEEINLKEKQLIN